MALNLNTEGPSRLLSFAMNCKKLRLFLHVSTGKEMHSETKIMLWCILIIPSFVSSFLLVYMYLSDGPADS